MKTPFKLFIGSLCLGLTFGSVTLARAVPIVSPDAATGTAVWSIDFNRDHDYLDNDESVTSLSPTLAGKGFTYVNI